MTVMKNATPLRLPAPAPGEVLEVLDSLVEERPYPPTIREIAERLGHPLSTIHGTLVDLRDAGAVDWEDRRPRTLRRV